MKIVFLTNSYTCTSVSYIKSLFKENVEIASIILLNPANITRIKAKAKKYGIGHIIKRAIDALRIRVLCKLASNGDKQIAGIRESIEVLIHKNSLKAFKVKDINSQQTIDRIQ